MSPASYRAAPPRVGLLTLAQPVGQPQNDPGRARTHPRWPAGPSRRATSRRERGRQPLGVGAGLVGALADGFADGPAVGVAEPVAAFWAFWNAVIAASSCWSAAPYCWKLPDCCAFRTFSVAVSTVAAACSICCVNL